MAIEAYYHNNYVADLNMSGLVYFVNGVPLLLVLSVTPYESLVIAKVKVASSTQKK